MFIGAKHTTALTLCAVVLALSGTSVAAFAGISRIGPLHKVAGYSLPVPKTLAIPILNPYQVSAALRPTIIAPQSVISPMPAAPAAQARPNEDPALQSLTILSESISQPGSASADAAAGNLSGHFDGQASAPAPVTLTDMAALMQKPYSQARRILYENLPAYAQIFKELPSNISIKKLDRLPLGTYRLDKKPRPAWIRKLLDFRDNKSEIGLVALGGYWFLTLADQLAVGIHPMLAMLRRSNLFALDMHTHPPDLYYSHIPSWGDFTAQESASDRTFYIASRKGITEISGGNRHDQPLYAFQDWLKAAGIQITDEFRKGAWIPYAERFFAIHYNMRVIPWSQSRKIAAILSKGDDPSALRKPYEKAVWNQGWHSMEPDFSMAQSLQEHPWNRQPYNR